MHNKIGVSIRQLARDITQFSLATIFRHAKKNLQHMSVPIRGTEQNNNKTKQEVKKKTGRGRPRKVSNRDERNILRSLHKLRELDGACTSKKVQLDAGVTHIANRTVRHFLNKNGYSYLQARRKGLMSKADLKRRTKFARKMIKDQSENVWKKDICFYLDGSSFIHKTNPADQARAPMAKVWRKKNEGLKRGCTAKGKKAGSGGKAAHFMVCISYGKGVCFTERYEKLTGTFFADFVKRNFRKIFKSSVSARGNKFIQDGDPSQNSKAAKKEMELLNVQLFSIPPRSPDINPIENVFHLLDRKLKSDAISKNITHETFTEFCDRVEKTLKEFPATEIDKIIDTMPKRMKEIVKCRGERL